MKLVNNNDVLEWANQIVQGKGEKFIPLSKADMFVLAKYVLEHMIVSTPETAVGESSSSSDEGGSGVKEDIMETCSATVSEPTIKVSMPRGEHLHNQGLSTQQAYDKFLDWSREHPKEGEVMDFSTGVRSTNAAFAYWLLERIAVDIPSHTSIS